MPDIHLPKVHSTSAWKLLLEVALIALGVFLGLMGEQWREHAQHRDLAETTLRRFAQEIRTNRASVVGVQDYHVTRKAMIEQYFAADAAGRPKVHVSITGIRPAVFQHSAWDLALATQALAYIDGGLAAELSTVYTSQQDYASVTSSFTPMLYQPDTATYVAGARQTRDNFEVFLSSVLIYYQDLTGREPELLKMYDKVLPQLDRAIGESSR